MLRASLGLTTIGALLLCVGSAHAQGFVAVPNHADHWDQAHHDRDHWDHDHWQHEHAVEYRAYHPHVDYRVVPQTNYYVAPQPVYVAPQPTCVTPQPTYVVPQSTYYAPQPHLGVTVVGRNFGFSVGH